MYGPAYETRVFNKAKMALQAASFQNDFRIAQAKEGRLEGFSAFLLSKFEFKIL
jgi:hypothetical protein